MAVAVAGRGCGRPWLWQAVAVAGHGCGRPWLWQAMTVAGRGCGRPWLWQAMAVVVARLIFDLGQDSDVCLLHALLPPKAPCMHTHMHTHPLHMTYTLPYMHKINAMGRMGSSASPLYMICFLTLD